MVAAGTGIDYTAPIFKFGMAKHRCNYFIVALIDVVSIALQAPGVASCKVKVFGIHGGSPD
jgi:hypothetical protein